MFKGGLIVYIAFAVAGLITSISYGQGEASIKEDCEKLGQFYIDDVVYECKVKE